VLIAMPATRNPLRVQCVDCNDVDVIIDLNIGQANEKRRKPVAAEDEEDDHDEALAVSGQCGIQLQKYAKLTLTNSVHCHLRAKIICRSYETDFMQQEYVRMWQ
jgi:hypothetical protein